MLQIIPTSYHIFEFEGDQILFDRHTGLTCEVNEITYDFLTLNKEYKSTEIAVEKLEQKHKGLDEVALANALELLKTRGLFKVINRNLQQENAYIKTLLKHKPRRIQLMMAESCNLKCKYCYAWRNKTLGNHVLMSYNLAKKSVDFLIKRSANRKNLQITFFGGEPLLNIDTLKKIVTYCQSIKEKNFVFELITNGTLLSKDITDYLVENKFLLFISLDGWHEMHNYNRPSVSGKNLHDIIVKNAQYANKQYMKHKLILPKIRANLTEKYHDLSKCANYFESLGFKTVGIGAIEPLPHDCNSPSCMTENQMDDLHELHSEMMLSALKTLSHGGTSNRYIQRKFNQARQPLVSKSALGIICGVCRNTLIVDTKGELFPCHRYAGMQTYNVGDINSGLDEEKIFSYYSKLNSYAHSHCADCWIRDYCAGGCSWLLSDNEGEIHPPSDRECNRRRSSMERGLWLKKELRKRKLIFDDKENLLDKWDWNMNDSF